MSFCINCGKPLTDGAAFCINCGFAVAPAQPAAPQPPVFTPSVAEPVTNTGFFTPAPPIDPEPAAVPEPASEPVFRAAEPEPAPVFEPQPEFTVQPPVYQEPQYAPSPEPQQPLFDQQPVYQEPLYAPSPEPQQPLYNQPVYQDPQYAPSPEPQQPLYNQQPVYQQPMYTQQPVYQQQTAQNATIYQQNNYMGAAPGQPVYKAKTNRSLSKFFWLSLVTFGIYAIVFYTKLANDCNIIITRYDGRKTMHYCLVYFLFSWLTFGIVPLVWGAKITGRISRELQRRGINYGFGAGTYWGWNIFGTMIICGPFIYMHKLCKAMNLICNDYNFRG